jgi:hypothetical protein
VSKHSALEESQARILGRNALATVERRRKEGAC